MRIFKYIVFISILSSIFFVIYRQSDKKGFRRWWTSFKTAIIFSAIAASLSPVNPEAIEPPGNNNQVYQERLLLDQEFNSFEDNDQKVILVKAEGNPITPPTNRGPSNFPTPSWGGRPSRPVYVPKPRIAPKIVDPGLGAGANPAGAGGGGENPEFDDQSPVPKTQESKTFDYDSRSNSPKKKSKSQDQCSIDEQNKAGIDELPDSSEYIYNLETKTARKALKAVWKNTEAKKEVLAGLDKIDSGKLLPRSQKNFKGFKTLKELKFTKTRMLVQPGINGGPDQIVAIFMRRDMDNIALNFKGKYK
jgi:hypothetical protein